MIITGFCQATERSVTMLSLLLQVSRQPTIKASTLKRNLNSNMQTLPAAPSVWP